MGQRSECDWINTLGGSEFEFHKKVTFQYSSNDDSSDSDGRKRKRIWKRNESIGKMKSDRKYLAQKCNPYRSKKIIVSPTSYKNYKKFDDSSVKVSSNSSKTTIELRKVPLEMNNIIQLFQCFSQFGEITLIQINRNNDSRALISFKTISEARRAMEKASSVIPKISVSWFVDYCLLKRFPKLATKNNELGLLKNDNIRKQEATLDSDNAEIFRNTLENVPDPYMKSTDVVNSISKLIKMKNNLLFDQLKSRNEIADKLGKCKSGSDEEKMLLFLFKKVQEQINDNQRSIEHSLKQKTEIHSNSTSQHMSTNQDSGKLLSRTWMDAFKSNKNYDGCNEDLNFIPINLLDFGISYNKNEVSSNYDDLSDDDANDGSENYFSSRYYGQTVNICSPRKP